MVWRKGNRLPLMPENQASPKVREIYDSIRQSFGIPYVATFFQAYGMYPQFLELFWKTAAPYVVTRQFASCAERLRAEAFTRIHNYFAIPDFSSQISEMKFSVGARREVSDTIELFYLNVPLTLMLSVMQLQAFDAPVGRADIAVQPMASHRLFPKVIFIDEETASPQVAKIYSDIKHIFSTPVVHRMYRAFARWPDFLEVYAATLKDVISSPIFQHSEQGVREHAWQLVSDIPGPYDLTSERLIEEGIPEEDVVSLVRITELFSRTLPSTLLNVAVAKIGIEGGNRVALRTDDSTGRITRAG